LLTKMRFFSPKGAESYEFFINSAALSGFHRNDAMSFRLEYSSCE
jgi:hypothetical protein